MRRKRTDSTQWTGVVGTPASLPPHLQSRASRPLYTREQSRALAASFLFVLSPLLLWLASFLVAMSSSDLLVEAPALTSSWPVPIVLGFGLWWAADRDHFPRWCERLAVAGSVAVVAAALVYVVLGLSARTAAAAGPVQRAQVAAVNSHGRGMFKSTTTTFALQDGSTAATTDYSGGTRLCLAVRRVSGAHGFAWLRIVDRSPSPGPGQLAWPIDRGECFSAADLATMTG